MNSSVPVRKIDVLVNWVLGLTIAHLAVGIVTHTAWLTTGNLAWLRYYFDYQGAILLVGFSVLEVVLALGAFRRFGSDQPLRSAWLLILLAAACHLLGGVLKHLLSVHSYLNPLTYITAAWNAQAAAFLANCGAVLGGPLQMLFLAWGLYLCLRVYRESGLLGKLTGLDWVLVALGLAYACVVICGIVSALSRGGLRSITWKWALTWPNDLLSSILLFEAVFLRRSAANMGWGLVARVWGTFAIAIFLTLLGSVSMALAAYTYVPWPENSFGWYIWYLASAAYVLAPAYQLQASSTARLRLEEALSQQEAA